MRVDDLPVFGLEQIGLVAVQDARQTAIERGGVLPGFDAVACGFDPDQADSLILNKGMEQADRVRPAANARHDGVRQAALALLDLLARLAADDGLKITDEFRVGMRARGGANAVEC